ncbi:unnamed protein product [Amoebophrya sp. A25]|nr:unnamed protein product [Amoebophrya sp. A25]|eukprot:GSA25T00009759001.1
MKGFEDAAQAHNDASRINRALSLARSRKPEADARAAPPVRYYPPAKACFYNEAPEATREVVEDSESFTRDGSWSTESFMRDSMAAEFFATMRSGKSAVGLWSDAKGRANGQQFPRVNLTNNQLITGDGLLGANSAERCSSRTSNTEAKGGVPRMTPINSATTTALSPPRSLSTARVAAGTGKGTRFSGSSLGSSTGQQNITAGNSKGGGRRSQRVTASAYDSYATLVKPSSPPSLEKSTAVPGLIDIDADLVHIHYNNYVNTSTIVEGLQDRGADSSESFRASIFSRGSTRSQMPEGEKTPDFITLASLRMRLIKRKENEERAMAASDDLRSGKKKFAYFNHVNICRPVLYNCFLK